MTNKICFNSYNNSSRSLDSIRAAITEGSILLRQSSPVVRKIQSNTVRNGKKLVVSWGNSSILPYADNVIHLNNGDKRQWINKKEFFAQSSTGGYESLLVQFTTSATVAQGWLVNSLNNVGEPFLVERNVLDGHSGEGIRLLCRSDEVTPSAQLWTVYKKKKDEYRVHFFKTFDGRLELYVQKKLLKRDINSHSSTFKVRNVTSGWVYSSQENERIPARVLNAAVHMAFMCSLDFGSIDIIHNDRSNAAYVLEVNTASGAVESTARWYANCISNFLRQYLQVGSTRADITSTSLVVLGVTPQMSISYYFGRVR